LEPDQHIRLSFARPAHERSQFGDGRVATGFMLLEVRCQPAVVSECLSAPLFRHFLGARIEKLPKEDRYASCDQAGVFLGGLHGL
jgi:hypothetical protein